MKYNRIDAYKVNFADSCSDKNLKIKETTGLGEARIYIGHNEKEIDDFVEFDKVEYFFVLKNDLKKYLIDAKSEYFNPSQEYRIGDVSKLYDSLVNEINQIQEEKIVIKFKKTFDKQNRYYLVLEEFPENRKNYSYLRRICLPRITELSFVKIESNKTGKRYIYFKPMLCVAKNNDEIITKVDIDNENYEERKRIQSKNRKGQLKYRIELLEKMPCCVFTNVSDDRILEACHIKPFTICDENEQYNVKNGITMTPTYHVMFDLGFISFKDDGCLMVSPFLSNLNKNRLNLKENQRYNLQSGSEIFLDYHRKFIYNKIPNIDDIID